MPALTLDQYEPDGMTALYDAFQQTVQFVANITNEGEKVIYAIITDGLDNSSKNTSKQQVIELIGNKLYQHNWNFFYVGPFTNVWSHEMGFKWDSVVSFAELSEMSVPMSELNRLITNRRKSFRNVSANSLV